ncbi:hypothetical protein U0C82_10935 [Fulvimarina sp. 2208YS6-2-32]|uniref:Uncharacterized protein n=1 Tax=Fulvimarina uroteuthidis TaxID=3098149 RepID=A0ABU5I2Q2_9HYPH|nr:hypothetical protein [Fulvimarina sp. 2208YS6-2-32]MDY8109652.1 hypothetical protein [Fulvimarina sp. 2208YS6-2-32]
MGKAIGAIIAIIIVVVVAYFLFFFVDVDVTQEGSLPEVNVEGGELPEADVQTGDVNVGSEERTVEVPTIDIEPAPEDGAEQPATSN